MKSLHSLLDGPQFLAIPLILALLVIYLSDKGIFNGRKVLLWYIGTAAVVFSIAAYVTFN